MRTKGAQTTRQAPSPPLQNHDDMTGREIGGAREKKGPKRRNLVSSFEPQVDVVDVVIIEVIKKVCIIGQIK